jgi:hypothetical protein
MKPINTLATNFTYLCPTPGGQPLPCMRTSDGQTISVWKPTDHERTKIYLGANIELRVYSVPPPPVAMVVTDHKELLPAAEAAEQAGEIMKAAIERCRSELNIDPKIQHLCTDGGTSFLVLGDSDTREWTWDEFRSLNTVHVQPSRPAGPPDPPIPPGPRPVGR